MYIDVSYNIFPLCENIETIRANVEDNYKLSNLPQMNIHIFELNFFNSQQVTQLAIIMIKELSIS